MNEFVIILLKKTGESVWNKFVDYKKIKMFVKIDFEMKCKL